MKNNDFLKQNISVRIIFDMFKQLNLPPRYQIFCFINMKGKLIFEIYDDLGDVMGRLLQRIPNTDIYEGAYKYIEMFNMLKQK